MRMRTWRSTRRRPRPFMTDRSDDDHFRSMTRSGSIIRASSSFLASYTPDGMVLTWLWNCLMADRYSSPTSHPVENSR